MCRFVKLLESCIRKTVNLGSQTYKNLDFIRFTQHKVYPYLPFGPAIQKCVSSSVFVIFLHLKHISHIFSFCQRILKIPNTNSTFKNSENAAGNNYQFLYVLSAFLSCQIS